MEFKLISFFGFWTFAALAWATGGRRAFNFRTFAGAAGLAWVLGAIVFMFPGSRSALSWLNDALVGLIVASQKGAVFLFGPLALGPGQTLPDGTRSVGFILAVQVLPSVIFFSAIVGALYYLKVMQGIVGLFAKLFYKFLGVSGAESLAAASNIFVGVESGIAVRPFLRSMTRSELLMILTCMMATVASTVLGIYVIALKDVIPNIAGHLVSASIISIPCAAVAAKLFLPEEDRPETLGRIPEEIRFSEQDAGKTEGASNLMTALLDGGAQGMKMAVGIATALIVALGVEAIIDLALTGLPSVSGQDLSLERIMGWLTLPFVALLGLNPEEWQAAARILGSRFIETEVASYFSLAALQAGDAALSPRSVIILAYSLCGFVHLASFGIFVGGLSALVPERMREISVLGMKALWTSFLATLMTGSIAGVFV
ncbi:MAG: nucleoside permease nupX [Candidatus Nitrohelix vancouverensis]|uniref:Nucleoside permease nupX n=1 Tax=Candidatus Nitrohelix vancouverensis TaxID=2705534 RepID=A0A7T0C4P2_9BACT|nr:MAG: nucleoside permease nupX [Candidatus Nitrohelix vancouverensis]